MYSNPVTQRPHLLKNTTYHNSNKRGGIKMEEVKASMAGNVWKIVVEEGETVEEDQDIVILESMKMEIPIPAEDDGTVKEIKVEEGDFVNEGDTIAIIE